LKSETEAWGCGKISSFILCVWSIGEK